MSAHAYTEDQLVQLTAVELFAELGWQVTGPPPNAGMAVGVNKRESHK